MNSSLHPQSTITIADFKSIFEYKLIRVTTSQGDNVQENNNKRVTLNVKSYYLKWPGTIILIDSLFKKY